MISSVRKFASLAFSLQTRPVCRFADNWKDRDEASEKVYITEAESKYVDTQRKLSSGYSRKWSLSARTMSQTWRNSSVNSPK